MKNEIQKNLKRFSSNVCIDKNGYIDKNKITEIDDMIRYNLNNEIKSKKDDSIIEQLNLLYYVVRTIDFLKVFKKKSINVVDLFKEENKIKVDLNKLIDYISIAREYVPTISIHQKQKLICSECSSYKMIENKENNEISCEDCGFIYDNRILGIKDIESINSCRSSYTLKTNLLKAINKFEGGNCSVEKKILERIKVELGKKQIQIKNLQNCHIIKILKDWKLSKYYEEVRSIVLLLKGDPPISLKEHIPKLIELHDLLEFAYISIKDPFRINSLNVHFKLFKLLKLCKFDCDITDFCMLKTENKLEEHEEKWKEICKINNWEIV
uniref:TFIIB-type domain-containing protein n=1 Tax=viral metagenome TaxID=1070528 RepID=A0A6C0JV14_9ZZZZ